MCECTHDEICQGNTPRWMDVNFKTCAWYEKNELPVSLNGGAFFSPAPPVMYFVSPL